MFDLTVFAVTLSILVVARYLAETVLVHSNRAHLTAVKDLIVNNGMEFGIFLLLQGSFWYFCFFTENVNANEALGSLVGASLVFMTIKLITIVTIRRRIDQQGE